MASKVSPRKKIIVTAPNLPKLLDDLIRGTRGIFVSLEIVHTGSFNGRDYYGVYLSEEQVAAIKEILVTEAIDNRYGGDGA